MHWSEEPRRRARLKDTMADSKLDDHSDMADAEETPPSTSASTNPSDESDAASDAPQQMVVRRAPKIAPFLVTGAVFGIIVACFWVALQGSLEEYSQTQTLGFLAAVFAIIGLTVAALVWLFVDRRSKRHTETVYARRTEDPAAADVALTKDDYSEWSQFQKQQRAEEARRARLAEAKAEAKTKKRNRK